MIMRFPVLFLFAIPLFASLFTAVTAQPPPDQELEYPLPPKLEYLYTVNITGGQGINIGPGPRGNRVVYPILGGSFKGPLLRGELLPIGGDWALIGDDDNDRDRLTADVRQTLKTDDGAHIQVFETGTSQGDGTTHVRLSFETGDARYDWLNLVVAVGVLRRLSPTALTIDTWQMVSLKQNPDSAL